MLRALVVLLVVASVARSAEPGFAEIRVIDAETKQGVPLVELTTVHHVLYVTDNAGRIAFAEPEQFNRETFFSIQSPGYEVAKDGFGFRGVRVTPVPGKVVEIPIKREMLAERLCRLTGEGKYRETLLLNHPSPLTESAHPGRVAGQDSVQVAAYKGKRYWFWGDTIRLNYPLGMFRTAGARTPLILPDPRPGVAFDYFTDKAGFARAMMPLAERPEGVIWITGVAVVPDEKGQEALIAHYSRRKGLADELEHGIARFDDATETFVPLKTLAKTETWRFPSGHPILHEQDGKKWLLCGDPAYVVRVPATLKAVLDADQYEAFTPLDAKRKVLHGDDLKPQWRWQKELPPLEADAEYEFVKRKEIAEKDARFTPTGDDGPVKLHRGTVNWNEHRKRWILVASQLGGKTSHLGEVWYSESQQPTGPFHQAVKIVTHQKMSFYNPCHHPFLDTDGGRTIHFEGTYTADFSGNTHKTPRYEYNQILYRLDLETRALKAARAD